MEDAVQHSESLGYHILDSKDAKTGPRHIFDWKDTGTILLDRKDVNTGPRHILDWKDTGTIY